MASTDTGPSSTAGNNAQQSDTPQALKSWWNNFKKGGNKKKGPLTPAAISKEPAAGAIFGVPLSQSIKYANVAISLMQEDGSSYTYGYIPIVVAKCGVYLKDKATEIEGIFRLAGSARRIVTLQEIFNTPDKYGKGLDWTGYTVHDAANVLRRYLNQLPEPIVPLDLYEEFRNPLKNHQLQAVGNVEAKEADAGDFDYDGTIKKYRTLITQLPPLNRQLLLYILDMLAIFAAKSNINQMTAANLAVIFQPGMLHHPQHDKVPAEYRLSQDVVIFLIDQQDNFLLGMPGTAADEKTRQEIEAGPPPGTGSSTPTNAAGGLGRSVSTASRSTGGSGRLAGVRRNLSVSSRGSRTSGIAAPATPDAPTSGTPGVHRSNTVPSRKSPAIAQGRFARPGETPAATPDLTISPAPLLPQSTGINASSGSAPPVCLPSFEGGIDPRTLSLSNKSVARDQSKERLLSGEGATQSAGSSATRRGLAGLLRSPASDDGSQGRQPNKLRKKRLSPGAQPSGNNSAASLSADPDAPRSPHVSAAGDSAVPGDESSRHGSGQPIIGAFALNGTPPIAPHTSQDSKGKSSSAQVASQHTSDSTLRPENREAPNERSDPHAEITDSSVGNELEEQTSPSKPEKKEKRRWRFSVSTKKNNEERQQLAATQRSVSNVGSSDADLSKSSVQSWGNRRSSAAGQEKPALAELNSEARDRRSKDFGNTSEEKSPTTETSEKKGPIGWFKQKLAERKEKEAGKERARSPRRSDLGHGPSSPNLDAVANGDMSSRQRSTDFSNVHLMGTSEERAKLAPVPHTQKEPLTEITSAVGPAGTAAPLQTVLPYEATIPMQGKAVPYAPSVQSTEHEPQANNQYMGKNIEEYMNDSDREKLRIAQQTQRHAVANDQGQQMLRSGPQAPMENARPSTKDISIDPNYKAEEIGKENNAGELDPETPKASRSKVLAPLSAAQVEATPERTKPT